jgi:hypothetical protein
MKSDKDHDRSRGLCFSHMKQDSLHNVISKFGHRIVIFCAEEVLRRSITICFRDMAAEHKLVQELHRLLECLTPCQ